MLAERYDADVATTTSLVEYIRQQRAATGGVPDERVLIVEQFRDEMNSLRVVIHAPFGGRVNAPWGLALANRVREWLSEKGRGAGDGPTSSCRCRRPTTASCCACRASTTAFRSRCSASSPPEAERRVLAEVGASSLFGARFRMNAARALLLPRGNPRRRMPLWLQRLKALDLLQAVQEFPSFPILVETYRDVLQDAFDMTALARVLDDLSVGAIAIRSVETQLPSPFAASLQFGFVMDWLYADDAPRAEQRAALLSLDRALLDELMGGEGADDSTLDDARVDALPPTRNGAWHARAHGRRACGADRPRRRSHASTKHARASRPSRKVAATSRSTTCSTAARYRNRRSRHGGGDRTTRHAHGKLPRYVAAFGAEAFATVYSGIALEPRPVADVIPESMRRPAVTPARRTTRASRALHLARWSDLGRRRAARATTSTALGSKNASANGRARELVRGTFGGDASTPRWGSRRLLEQARRRELAHARKQIEAVDLARFSRFIQRWQHLDPATRLPRRRRHSLVVRQMYGLARTAERWEHDYLPARLDGYDPDVVSRLIAAGELVWVGEPARRRSRRSCRTCPPIRFLRRGSARAGSATTETPPLGEQAQQVLDALQRDGASFFDELATSTALTTRNLRDALRELVGGGLVTNDTIESLRQSCAGGRSCRRAIAAQPDPTRWLPADFSPSANRYVVQRRPNLRRLPKWKRPDKKVPSRRTGPADGRSCARRACSGPRSTRARWPSSIARQWLERYGIVSREMWRRERPAVGWRAIYRELKRLEFRGEVRRGYFVRGLSGAQFALPEAVEMLRSATPRRRRAGGDDRAPIRRTSSRCRWRRIQRAIAFVRPRSRGALLVTIDRRRRDDRRAPRRANRRCVRTPRTPT